MVSKCHRLHCHTVSCYQNAQSAAQPKQVRSAAFFPSHSRSSVLPHCIRQELRDRRYSLQSIQSGGNMFAMVGSRTVAGTLSAAAASPTGRRYRLRTSAQCSLLQRNARLIAPERPGLNSVRLINCVFRLECICQLIIMSYIQFFVI